MLPKLCFNIEYAVEVEAEARLKRKADAQQEASASAVKIKSRKSSRRSKANNYNSNANKRQKCRPRRVTGIKKVRNERRERQMKKEEEESRKRKHKASLGLENQDGTIVAGQKGGDYFWEVDAVIGRRINHGRVEYHIRWKDCPEEDNTWEPAANLCDTASELYASFLFHKMYSYTILQHAHVS